MGTVRENIALNIKKFREASGMSQRELARELGVGYSLVSNWELGLNSPKIEALIQMCELFDIKLTTIYGLSTEAERKAQKLLIAYRKAPANIQRMIDTALELNQPIPEQRDREENNGR